MERFYYLLLFAAVCFAACKKDNQGSTPPPVSVNLLPLDVSVFAGGSSIGLANGTGNEVRFRYPTDIAINASGNLYVADAQNGIVRKITPAGLVSSFVGNPLIGGNPPLTTGVYLSKLYAVTTDGAGNVYAGDSNNIRKITPDGTVSTLAGNDMNGNVDGTGAAASFNFITGMVVDATGNIYVTDSHNRNIRKITAAGVVTTLAGSGTAGNADGAGVAASFTEPSGITIGAGGDLYVTDAGNHNIRKVTLAGVVSTFAGSGTPGKADGIGKAASFYTPMGITADAAGNLYVADFGNNVIRKISPAGVTATYNNPVNLTNGAANPAYISQPTSVAVDAAGNLFTTSGCCSIHKGKP